MKMKHSAPKVAEDIRLSMKMAQATLDQFTAAVASDPVYAFEWSEGAMESAAYLRAANLSLAYLEDESGGHVDREERTVQFWMREALQGARAPKRSTSSQSNAMSAMLTSAYATLLDRYTRS